MDHEGKKALLEKMRNYPFHAIFDRRGRKDSSVNMQNAHLVPYGIQSKSIGVDIFTDDVTKLCSIRSIKHTCGYI